MHKKQRCHVLALTVNLDAGITGIRGLEKVLTSNLEVKKPLLFTRLSTLYHHD